MCKHRDEVYRRSYLGKATGRITRTTEVKRVVLERVGRDLSSQGSNGGGERVGEV